MKYYTKSACTLTTAATWMFTGHVLHKSNMKHACKHNYKEMMLPAFCQHVVSVHLTAKYGHTTPLSLRDHRLLFSKMKGSAKISPNDERNDKYNSL